MKMELETSILIGLTVLLGFGDYLVQTNQDDRGKGGGGVFIIDLLRSSGL